MKKKNEELGVGKRPLDLGRVVAPKDMDRAVRFLIHQMNERDEGVYCDVGMAVRFAMSCSVPKGEEEVNNVTEEDFSFYQPKARDFSIGPSFLQWSGREVDGVKISDKGPMRKKLQRDVEAYLKAGKTIKEIKASEPPPGKGQVIVSDTQHGGLTR